MPGRAQDRSAQDYDALYSGTPPWEFGRPQPVFVRLTDDGRITGRLLDAECGSGENALMLAEWGLDVVGIDVAPTATAIAQEKADARGLSARFEVRGALAERDGRAV